MTHTRAHLKVRAKALLIGNSGKAVALLLIPGLFSLLLKGGGLFTAASGSLYGSLSPFFTSSAWQYAAPAILLILSGLSLIILTPVLLGRDAWFWERSAREYRPFTYAFSWYKKMGRAIALYLIRWGIRLCSGLFFLFPAAAFTLASLLLYIRGCPLYTLVILAGTSAALWIFGAVYTTLFLQRFFLVPYLIAGTPELRVCDAFRKSSQIMDSCMMRGNTAKMKLSFFPWFLSCILVLPVLYVYPYYKQACACYARHILNYEKTPDFL